MSHDGHDHDHSHDPIADDGSAVAARVRALEELLVEKGVVTRDEVRRRLDWLVSLQKKNGAILGQPPVTLTAAHLGDAVAALGTTRAALVGATLDVSAGGSSIASARRTCRLRDLEYGSLGTAARTGLRR